MLNLTGQARNVLGGFFRNSGKIKCLPLGNKGDAKRGIWEWLNPVFNRYDKERVNELGGDRSCAEWLLRNGASVKFAKSEDFLKDYNLLPPVDVKPVIVEVDATDSCISMDGGGFRHFEHTKNIRKLKLHRCNYVHDDALHHLTALSSSLRDLQVSSCQNVTDDGILDLANLTDLEKLYVYDVPGVQDRMKCLRTLQNRLTKCTINFPWAKESEKPPEK